MITTFVRRACAVLAVTAVLAVAGPFDISHAEAGVHSSSEAVAAEAGRALDALDLWHATHRPIHYVRFLRARAHTAGLLAADFGVSADRLATDWAGADEHKQVAFLSALTQLGVPYRSLQSKPGVGFDCSGLTSWAFAQAGIELPRVSGDQIRDADRVAADEAEPGDLTWYPGHVSIYLGEELLVHSPNTGNTVEVIEVPGRTQRYGDAVSANPPAASAGTVSAVALPVSARRRDRANATAVAAVTTTPSTTTGAAAGRD